MIKRTDYLNELNKWKDEQVIKVVTGIRRCGKSTLLEQFQTELVSNGISREQIIAVNFEALEFEELLDYKVNDYQKAVDSLFIRDNIDIYITGSNAYLLSGELATLLSGRYVEINMLPLSFAEYRIAKTDGSDDAAFADYLRLGGLPYIVTLDDANEKADTYLEGIYNTIIIKDIEERQKRKDKEKI